MERDINKTDLARMEILYRDLGIDFDLETFPDLVRLIVKGTYQDATYYFDGNGMYQSFEVISR